MGADTYYVKSGESEKGPYTIAVLRASLRDGSLKRATLVRAEGQSDWVRLDEIVKPEPDASDRASAMRVQAEEQVRLAGERKQRDVLIGGLICFVGIVVTLATYSSASGGGGRYVIAWGAILFGGIRMVRGLSR